MRPTSVLPATTPGDAAGVVALLRQVSGQEVVVVTHEAPDGDAIGSLLAMAHLIESLGGRPAAICVDPVPPVYAFLPGADDVSSVLPKHLRPDLAVFVDCANSARPGDLTGLATLISAVPSVNIDHHVSNTGFAQVNWVQPAASSTGEMIAGLFELLGMPYGAARDALYVAIITDTGSFAYESTAPSTHRVAAALLDAGARSGELHDLVYGARERAELDLLGLALGSLCTAYDGQLAYMVLGAEDFMATQAGPEHANGIVNYARNLSGAQIGMLFSSHDGREVKVGIRTRPGVDANLIAAGFGGGGHARAASCRLEGSVAEVVQRVLAAAGEQLSKS